MSFERIDETIFVLKLTIKCLHCLYSNDSSEKIKGTSSFELFSETKELIETYSFIGRILTDIGYFDGALIFFEKARSQVHLFKQFKSLEIIEAIIIL